MSLTHPSLSGRRSLNLPSEDSDEVGDPAALPLSLFALEFSLDTTTLDALEAVVHSVTRDRVKEWFSQSLETREVAVLTTCHRVELLGLARSPSELDRWRERLPGDRAAWTVREGRDVVHHLFRVAAGRESLAVGEAEVRDQVRLAAGSVLSRHPRSVLRELILGAASAADEACPSVPPFRSIASVAVDRLRDLVARPHPRVLVIGSGTVGRQVAERLAGFAHVTVVYHEKPPDAQFLEATGARAVRLNGLSEELAASDAVVTAAKFGAQRVRLVGLPRDRPVVLVDLGVPRNIDPKVRSLPNVRLVDLEELHALPSRRTGPEEDDDRVAALASGFADGMERLLLEPWVDAVRRAAEEVRRAELSHARPYLGQLDPSQELAVDRLTQRLVARLLLAPTERMRSLPLGPEGDRQRRFAVSLLRPPPPDP